MRLLLAVLLTVVPSVWCIKCHQCNGWHGDYPLSYSTPSTCDNRNHQCESNQFCVKIVDTMAPGAEYVTFKSDCFFQTQLQVNPQNLSYVQNRQCFPYQDGSAPVKRWMYCFCNDRDYCNASPATLSLLSLAALIITPALL